MRTNLLFLFLLFVSNIICAQRLPHQLTGKWKVTKAVYLATATPQDKEALYKSCVGKTIRIGNSYISSLKTSNCSIKAVRRFGITELEILSLDSAQNKYSSNFVTYVYEDYKVNSVSLYATNYVLANDALHDLKIIQIANNCLILFLCDTLIFLEKDK